LRVTARLSGTVKLNVAPCAARLVTQMRPPKNSMICLQIAAARCGVIAS
jgi:hypothetical protein